MKKIILPLIVIALASCTASDKSKRVLEQQGYTEIEITGYSPFSCSEDDVFSTGFKAKGPTGIDVEGTVCCGWIKNCTVRID